MSSNSYAKRSQMAPAARAVRAYAAPVNRVTGATIAFDPATMGNFELNAPPQPWIDLGWVEKFQRTAATKYEALRTGPNSNLTVQYRMQPEARVEFELLTWGKVQLALSSGTQQMNVLAEQTGGPPLPSGGMPVPSSPVQNGSTPTQIVLTSDQLALYNVGDIVAVDVDYNGQTGYLGAWAPGSYLSSPLSGPAYLDLVRRVTFNVSRVCAISNGALQLAEPLLSPPTAGMGVQKVVAFVDREGSSFFQEWSCLFIVAPDSGGRSCFYYPRLQPAAGAAETQQEFASPLFSHQLHVSLRALPTTDTNDNETVLCYRSYFPATNAAV
ncbi:MAG TPA: hypothetical protein VLV47_00395 [Candidatus Bathyarchaeia archaeon]|nr:hypothetical protein [Candidatus Bathyarchaeia archaeon]